MIKFSDAREAAARVRDQVTKTAEDTRIAVLGAVGVALLALGVALLALFTRRRPA